MIESVLIISCGFMFFYSIPKKIQNCVWNHPWFLIFFWSTRHPEYLSVTSGPKFLLRPWLHVTALRLKGPFWQALCTAARKHFGSYEGCECPGGPGPTSLGRYFWVNYVHSTATYERYLVERNETAATFFLWQVVYRRSIGLKDVKLKEP